MSGAFPNDFAAYLDLLTGGGLNDKGGAWWQAQSGVDGVVPGWDDIVAGGDAVVPGWEDILGGSAGGGIVDGGWQDYTDPGFRVPGGPGLVAGWQNYADPGFGSEWSPWSPFTDTQGWGDPSKWFQPFERPDTWSPFTDTQAWGDPSGWTQAFESPDVWSPFTDTESWGDPSNWFREFGNGVIETGGPPDYYGYPPGFRGGGGAPGGLTVDQLLATLGDYFGKGGAGADRLSEIVMGSIPTNAPTVQGGGITGGWEPPADFFNPLTTRLGDLRQWQQDFDTRTAGWNPLNPGGTDITIDLPRWPGADWNVPNQPYETGDFEEFIKADLEPWIERIFGMDPSDDYPDLSIADGSSGYDEAEYEGYKASKPLGDIQSLDSEAIAMPDIEDYTSMLRQPLISNTLDAIGGFGPGGTTPGLPNPYDTRRDAYLSGAHAPIDQYYDEAAERSTSAAGVLNKLGTPGFREEIVGLERDRASMKGQLGSQWEMAAAGQDEGMRRNRLADLSNLLTSEFDRTQREIGTQAGIQQQATQDYYTNLNQYQQAYNAPDAYRDAGLNLAIAGLAGAPAPAPGAAMTGLNQAGQNAQAGMDITSAWTQNLWKNLFGEDN